MDHTLLDEKLLCSQCHFDKHDGLFGQECRECHLISTWKIEGYRHPPETEKACSRCHKAPHSHYEPGFWQRIEKGMGEEAISPEDCRLCHGIRDWRHRKMGHGL